MRTIDRNKVIELALITTEALPEDIDFVGNCSVIDEKTDKKTEQRIREQLQNGNGWAWCTIHVSATIGEFSGHDYLGGCSYKNGEEFMKEGGYYEDMKSEAIDRLISNIESAGQTIESVLES
jgi:hypothetical protein